MFDQHLVHAIIGGKDLDCGSAEFRVNLALTRRHGSLLHLTEWGNVSAPSSLWQDEVRGERRNW
jgi:hypothetical protein